MKSVYVSVLSIIELKNARWNIEIHKVGHFKLLNFLVILLYIFFPWLKLSLF